MSRKKILIVGSSNTDMTIKGERLPAPGETILGGVFVTGPGGKGANQAVAAKRLGGDVKFICKVGEDIFGRSAIEGYRKEGINTDEILICNGASGIALIMVDDSGENVISVAPGANADLSAEDIDRLSDVIESSDYLILQLEIPIPAVTRAAQIAHNAGVYVILNPAPATSLPKELLENISLIVPNKTESALLTGIEISDEKSIDKTICAFGAMGIKDVVITLGSKGSIVSSRENYVMVPACKVKAIDATAAGDTFCGALCVALSEGMSLLAAAQFATKASALTVQKMGAQDSIPFRKDIK